MANGRSIPYVGLCVKTGEELENYLNGIQFGVWRPRFITLHHTGAPNTAQWSKYKTRNPPVTDERWMKNLARYYGVDMGWSSGPHFFFTPDHYCVLSPPTARGVHAVSFNATSWGVEMVGEFDTEKFGGAFRDKVIDGLAALHIAAGLKPGPFERGTRGLHFHRDDPRTSKTCPGRNVDKQDLIDAIEERMVRMSDGDHVDGKVARETSAPAQRGLVTSRDPLNVRADPSAKSPILRTLRLGEQVQVLGEAMNGSTKWLRIGEDDWVAARYVSIA